MITYDKYYQTPRIWFLGYDEASECVSYGKLIAQVNTHGTTQNGTPLVPEQMFQDVAAEHAFKTVTIEAFHHSTSLQAVSVHPCKHASVTRKLLELMNAGVVEEQKSQRKGGSKDSKKKWPFKRGSGSGKDDKPAGEEEEVEGLRVDFYLILFLKFIACVTPTIEVDSTAALSM
jgi:ubiquitin-like-conjugating enzyme ATG3